MSKIIAIDYGLKNIGIAFTNNKKNIIYGAKNFKKKKIFYKIKKYIIKYNIKYIVIG
ncbi:MAG: Holliday junction resolvase RuvX [Candidatus Shikimatogenerans sp. Tder]|uniref:Holliday junction resolvase RuvX n=1 Tax=Candidatus Shikimatogenerans sp. Tder TaxID=3158566 RepID=A0AAU7QS14_9FLAO